MFFIKNIGCTVHPPITMQKARHSAYTTEHNAFGRYAGCRIVYCYSGVTIVVLHVYLEFQIVEKDLVTESADPRPLGLVVSRLEMTFETLKLREGLVAAVLSSTL